MPNPELKVADVFLAINLALCGENPHYHIVVHKTDDDKILVVHTTKEIDKVKFRCRSREKIKFDYIEPDTAIIVNNTHSETFTLESAIDCNKVQLKPISFFTDKQEFKLYAPIKNLATIEVIKQGIKHSPIVEPVIKKMI